MKPALSTLSLSLLLLVLPLSLHAQGGSPGNPGPQELPAIEKRWQQFASKISLVTTTGETIIGQVILLTNTELIILPETGLPTGKDLAERVIRIPVADIKSYSLDRGGAQSTGLIAGAIAGGGAGVFGGIIIAGGWSIVPPIVLGAGLTAGGGWLGNKIQKGTRLSDVEIQENEQLSTSQIEAISRAALFKDEIHPADSPEELVQHSAKFRRTFPHKHLRISFTTSIGPNSVKKELVEMFESTSLPSMNEYRHGPIAFEFFDVAWRFNYHYIAGAQVMVNSDSYTYIWYANYNLPYDLDYYYDIMKFEGRFYFEYVAKPVDRYFTKRVELMAGGGLVLSSPSINFTYAYVPDIITGNSEVVENRYNPTIPGLHLRSSVHIYPYPGFSLFGGVEANILPGLEINPLTLPTETPGVDIEIPAYKLNFSTVRLKAGASIWF